MYGRATPASPTIHQGYTRSHAKTMTLYISEMGRTLEKKIKEHKCAMKTEDRNNGLAVHVLASNHRVKLSMNGHTGRELLNLFGSGCTAHIWTAPDPDIISTPRINRLNLHFFFYRQSHIITSSLIFLYQYCTYSHHNQLTKVHRPKCLA